MVHNGLRICIWMQLIFVYSTISFLYYTHIFDLDLLKEPPKNIKPSLIESANSAFPSEQKNTSSSANPSL